MENLAESSLSSPIHVAAAGRASSPASRARVGLLAILPATTDQLLTIRFVPTMRVRGSLTLEGAASRPA